ncbi:MAG: hypothetical protein RR420_00980 [Anaerovoracaceae bacterium]
MINKINKKQILEIVECVTVGIICAVIAGKITERDKEEVNEFYKEGIRDGYNNRCMNYDYSWRYADSEKK